MTKTHYIEGDKIPNYSDTCLKPLEKIEVVKM